MRARRTSGPKACRAWRASHATLWERGGHDAYRRFRRCRRYRRKGADAPRRTERAGLKGQTFHGHREQSAPVGRRTRCCAKRRQPQGQASKSLNLQTSTKLLRRFSRNEEAQGMGTVERPGGPNGEVPRPLRSFCVFVEKNLPSFHGAGYASYPVLIFLAPCLPLC